MQPRRRALALSALVLTATICTAPELCAQDGKAAVETAIMRVFEGMHTANPDMVRAVFAPDARFAVISASNGPAVIAAQTVDGWIEAIGGSEGRWDEQVYDLDINVDGDMASRLGTVHLLPRRRRSALRHQFDRAAARRRGVEDYAALRHTPD